MRPLSVSIFLVICGSIVLLQLSGIILVTSAAKKSPTPLTIYLSAPLSKKICEQRRLYTQQSSLQPPLKNRPAGYPSKICQWYKRKSQNCENSKGPANCRQYFMFHTTCGTVVTSPEWNLQFVKDFFQKVFIEKNVDAVDDYIIEHGYMQHNPYLKDGRDTFKNAVRPWFSRPFCAKLRRWAAVGDRVWIHSRLDSEVLNRTVAIVDIFRIENAKIVEHWDVIQDIPEMTVSGRPMT